MVRKMDAKVTTEQLEQIIDHVQEAVWILNRDSSFAYMNDLANRTFGIPEDQVHQYKMFDFFGAENIHFVQQIYKRVFEGHKQQFDIPLIDAEEKERLLRLRIIPCYQDGLIIGSLHYALDITEQKATERALDLTRERYQRLINDKTEIHIRLTPEGNIAFINHENIKELGQPREDVLGKHFHQLVPEENHGDHRQRHSSAYHGQSEHHIPNTHPVPLWRG